MTATTIDRLTAPYQATSASYLSHSGAETAVRSLQASGLDLSTITIIALDNELRNAIRGLYRPTDSNLADAIKDTWITPLFDMLQCDVAFFSNSAVGCLLVMGRLSRTIAEATADELADSLVKGLTAAGVPMSRAIAYEARLRANEFLVLVHGDPSEVRRAHKVLEDTAPMRLKTHWASNDSAGRTVTLGPKYSN